MGGNRHIGRHDLGTGFVMEHENLHLDVKGKRRVTIHVTSANTEASCRGRAVRSSVEAAVMAGERRDCVVWKTELINLVRGMS